MAVFIPIRGADSLYNGRQLGRLHVYGNEWGQYPGATDFWLSGDLAGQLGSAGAQPVLADAGWTATSMTTQAGSAADFASASDVGTPAAMITDAASDLIKSPVMFGDFMHMEGARYNLGTFPKYMMLEAYLRFATASNNETVTRFGFFEDGGSPIVAADALASMYSDGTNFQCGSGADTDAGAAVVTTPFGLRIMISPGTTDKIQWWLRTTLTAGFVSQGTFDLETDEFPCGFGFGQGSGGSNVIHLHWAHIFYSSQGRWPN